MVTEYLLKTVISCVKYIVREKRFHLFLNRLRLLYSIPKSFALLLAFHVARHTFGTLLVSAGVPMESIAKMMGHTNIRTTQGYAKVTDDKISEDMDRLMEKRNSMVQV